MSFFKLCILGLFVGSTFAGCVSSQMKARKSEREKSVQAAKIYCDFVNGEMYPDIEVVLNIEMAKHCDSEKTMSISNYKTPSENVGIMYCCSLLTPKTQAALKVEDPKSEKASAEDRKAEGKESK